MALSFSIPFLHPVFLASAAVGTVLALRLLPGRSWRLPAALALGLLPAAMAAAAGMLPWTGRLVLSAYGACLLAALVLAWLLAVRRAHHLALDRRTITDLVAVSAVAGIVGARARYVWERWQPEFLAPAGGDWGRALVRAADLDAGGAVWYGGFLLGAGAALALCHRRRIPLLPFFDLAAPATLAALAVGRLGCLLNGCCYGKTCDLPWAITGPHGQPVHPAQLYESLACGLLALGTWRLWGRRRRDGQVAFWALIGYALWRLLNEGLRDHAPLVEESWFGLVLTSSQVTSLWLLAATLASALWIGWRRRRHPSLAAQAALVPGSRHQSTSLSSSTATSPEPTPRQP